MIRHRTETGFTLIELAVVIAIVGLLLGAVLLPLRTQVELRQVRETEKQLADIKESLYGYAMANGYMPCPDVNGNGLEALHPAPPTSSNDGCQGGVYEGFVPWQTLSVAPADPWGNRYLYRVDKQFTRRSGDPTASAPGCVPPASCTLELGDTGNISVKGRDPKTHADVDLTTTALATVLSHGANGYGATGVDGTPHALPPVLNVDETENTDGDRVYRSRVRSPESVGCSDPPPATIPTSFCEYDDIVVWVSPYILSNRLVVSGQLP